MATFDLKDVEQFEQFVGVSTIKLELQNSKGDTAIMELEPLESMYLGRVVYLQNALPKPRILNPVEHKSGRPARYESDEEYLARLKITDYDAYGEMFKLLEIWIKQKYPDFPSASLRKFIMLNVGLLLNAFMKAHSDYDEETGKTREMKEFVKLKQQQMSEKSSE